MNTIYSFLIAVIPFYFLWRYKVALDAREALIDEVNTMLVEPKYSDATKAFLCNSFKDSTNPFLIFAFLFLGIKNIVCTKGSMAKKRAQADSSLIEAGVYNWEIEQVINPFIVKIITVNFMRAPFSHIFAALCMLLAFTIKYLLIAIGITFTFGVISNPAIAMNKNTSQLSAAKINVFAQAQNFWKTEHSHR
jgi:hypothetical protein